MEERNTDFPSEQLFQVARSSAAASASVMRSPSISSGPIRSASR
jgi:hypothetical protein